MRFRRLLILGLPLLVLGAACGEDAPDMGDAALPAAAADADPPGGAVGAMAADETTTTTTTTTTTVPEGTSPPVDAADGETADAVQALCDRVSILIVTADSMGPDFTDAELAQVVDGVESIGEEAAGLQAELSDEDAGALADCTARLDQLPI
jgi:hypothetical protein